MSLIIFIFGLIIGSFLNVVILRYNTGRSISGRSACLVCSKKLAWYELLPLLSFLVLRGRCRSCHSPISWQYPLVELGTAVIFTLTHLYLAPVYNFPLFLLLVFASSLLIVIFTYDLRHQIIPDFFVFLFILAGLFYPLLLAGSMIENFTWSLSGAFFTALPLFLLWFISAGRWLGFGDVKLALGLGLFLGPGGGLSALFVAFCLGAVIGLVLIALSHLPSFKLLKYNMKSAVPFAPFLILAFWLELFYSNHLINVLFF